MFKRPTTKTSLLVGHDTTETEQFAEYKSEMTKLHIMMSLKQVFLVPELQQETTI